jgi:hypothetical protein
MVGKLYARTESLIGSFYDDMDNYNYLSEYYDNYYDLMLMVIIELSFDGVPSVGRSMSNPDLGGAFSAKYW